MFTICQARELKTGQRILNSATDVWEVTAVVVGSRMVTVTAKPMMNMTGPAETQFHARPKDLVTVAEFE